jgi:hypothetical protein
MEALDAKEAGARARAVQLRGELGDLTRALADAEALLSRLIITRETVSEVLADGPRGADVVACPGPADLAVALIAAEAAGDVTVTSPVYQRILAVFAATTGPLRCREVCGEVGMETEARHVEGMRSRLKRMVERGLLAEAEPGLFTLAGGGGV